MARSACSVAVALQTRWMVVGRREVGGPRQAGAWAGEGGKGRGWGEALGKERVREFTLCTISATGNKDEDNDD